jgi:4-diphosphocytidyl-2-C-methyl-D-erythritol kinase
LTIIDLADSDAGAGARLAPAKINLALHVTGLRPNGYHTIESLAVFTRFGDRLDAAPAEADSFAVSGKYAVDVPADDGNLILKARDTLRQRFGADATPPVALSLEKNLPVASGIGGGSSDAAASLRALIKVWKLVVDEAELARIGLALGADVPMCLIAQPLLARGVGDELDVLPNFPSLGLVLVNPGVAVSTAEVFAGLEHRDNEKLPPLPKKIDFHSLRNWLEITRNDLQPVAQKLHPAIGRALSALKRADAGFARMSGSGATCFGLFETGNVAKRAAASIRSHYPEMFVAATRSLASGVNANGQN